jgi:hypothetical protein
MISEKIPWDEAFSLLSKNIESVGEILPISMHLGMFYGKYIFAHEDKPWYKTFASTILNEIESSTTFKNKEEQVARINHLKAQVEEKERLLRNLQNGVSSSSL